MLLATFGPVSAVCGVRIVWPVRLGRCLRRFDMTGMIYVSDGVYS
jgi:hypothetical protein